MIKVKVCGMCDPLNVREIAKAKPDFIGFIFYPKSLRYVGSEPAKSLFKNVPSDILRVGVFVDVRIKKIFDISSCFDLGIIQLHGNELPEYCFQIKSAGLKIIKGFHITDNFNFEKLKPYMQCCDYFLFDTQTKNFGGSGKKFNWEKLSEYNLDKPFFLSGGIGPEDVELIKTFANGGLFAVDVNSRFETVPGIKDVAMVKTFINEINNNKI